MASGGWTAGLTHKLISSHQSTLHRFDSIQKGAVYVAGELVLKGTGNRFTGNLAGHHDADVYVDEALGGRVLREEAGHMEL